MIVDAILRMSPTRKTFRFPNHGQSNETGTLSVQSPCCLLGFRQAAGCSLAISARFSSQNRPITFSVIAWSASTGKPAASQ